MSQQHLADVCDVDRSFVYRLENGLLQPTLSTLFALAAAFEMSPSDLVRLIEKGIGKKEGRS